MRVGALCSLDATYKTADDLQELVGKNLKLTYPDRSKVRSPAGCRGDGWGAGGGGGGARAGVGLRP